MKKSAFALSLCLWTGCLVSNCAYHEISWNNKEISGRAVSPLGASKPVSYNKPQLWNKRHLTWELDKVKPVPARLSEQELIREIDESFKSWEGAGVFTFSRARAGEPADIVISFGTPPGKPWDGQTGRMGHASFPWSRDRGHIYLDPAEWWSTRSFALVGDPITKWLPHEIGHVLGLQHTHASNETMSENGPYKMPDKRSHAQLRHLYAPLTPVFTWVHCVVDVSAGAE